MTKTFNSLFETYAHRRGVKMKRKYKNKVDIHQCLGHSSHHTHQLQPLENMYNHVMHKLIIEQKIATPEVIDPFARMCLWGTKRNDINPEFLKQYTTHNKDALEFLCDLETSSSDLVILDPPFSNRQSGEEYGTSNLYTNPAYMVDLGLQCFRILKSKGYVIKCGYNTNPPYKGFKLIHVKIIQLGASRNDILISLWQKVQTGLFD